MTHLRLLGSFQDRHAQFMRSFITDSVTLNLLPHGTSTLYRAQLGIMLGIYLTTCNNTAIESLSFIILTSLTNDANESNNSDLRTQITT